MQPDGLLKLAKKGRFDELESAWISAVDAAPEGWRWNDGRNDTDPYLGWFRSTDDIATRRLVWRGDERFEEPWQWCVWLIGDNGAVGGASTALEAMEAADAALAEADQ